MAESFAHDSSCLPRTLTTLLSVWHGSTGAGFIGRRVDPKFFLKAIMKAKCPKSTHVVTKPNPPVTMTWSETKAKCPTFCGLPASAPANPQQCRSSDGTKQPDSACIKHFVAKPRTTTKCPATRPCKCYDDNHYLAKTGINCAAAKTIVGCTHDMSKIFPGKVPKGSIVSKICVKACVTCKGNLCNSKNQCFSAGQGR
eukprot:COSAG01_NODE_1179_length_11363_cov_18.944701_11_plen_198_part_00